MYHQLRFFRVFLGSLGFYLLGFLRVFRGGGAFFGFIGFFGGILGFLGLF